MYHPCRFDTWFRDAGYALRTFRRAPLAALTVVGTVAIGLALVGVVFTFFNGFFFRTDAVRNPSELFSVHPVPLLGEPATTAFNGVEYQAMRRATNVFTGLTARASGVSLRMNDRQTNATLVSGNFFMVLGAQAALGRTLLPGDEEERRRAIVLSHDGWRELFGEDPSVIGRTVRLNGIAFEIVGVMRKNFRGLRLGAPHYWAPLVLVGQLRPRYAGREGEIPVDVIGRLQSGSVETATAALSTWIIGVRSGHGVRLRPRNGTIGEDAGEALMVFSPLFVAFGLILLIGCANVANLLLARGISRQREIGVRLSLGASRGRIVGQLLTENLLLALAAAACALLLSRMLLETVLYAAMTTMPPEMAEHMSVPVPPIDWRVVLFLAGGALISTVLFALLPALQATRVELVRAVRGEVVNDARPARARSVLIGVQVTASALLLVCAAVFLASALNASDASPGIRIDDNVMIDVDNEPARAAMVQALREHPAVRTVAASTPHALAFPWGTVVESAASGIRSHVGYKLVSPEFFDVLGIDVRRGRVFTETERGQGAAVVIVSESAARRLWPDGDPLGQALHVDEVRLREQADFAPRRTYTVVGVVRDVKSALQISEIPATVIYLPTSAETAGRSLTVRVLGDPQLVRQQLVDRLAKIDPAIGDVMTMRTVAGLERYVLRVASMVTAVLGGLALALTLSGLFSVLSYIVEQRAKEIGIRMALGATTRMMAGMVVAQSIPPVVVGLLAGACLAAAAARLVTATFDVANVIRVFDPVAYGGSLASVAAACAAAALVPALRAARVDPITTLRQD